ncbi:MAG TPA: acyl-CoA dehydrogenase family protein [Verrucomicrobiales bacterium]|nr:acyl-CoA dehydrogenase family protein [Verrucomicrobiales bacterium]
MDYTWSPKQKELLDSVDRFAKEHLKSDVIEGDREGRFDKAGWNKCGEFGFQGLPTPVEYGGRGLDPLTTVAVLERLGYNCRDNGLIFSINAHLWTVVMPLITSGSEEQKQRFLPSLSNGNLIGGNAMTEAGSGSDAFSLSATARRDGSKYILNGKKTFVSNGPVADVFTAYATVDPSLGANGVTAFLVEKGSPGLTVTRQLNKMGLRTSPTGELQFDNCEVSAANRIGEEGAGSLIFSRSMTWERGCILANAVGSMQRMLEMCVRFAKRRRQGGQPIGSFQHVAGKIVEMKLRLETSRQLLYHGAWLRSCGKSGFMEAAMTKLHLSDSWIKSCEDAIQIHGGYGYTVECELERELRDAMGSRLYSGTSEIQKNLIASLLGL